jgi:transposase
VHGTRDPDILAQLARGGMRARLPALREALVGHFRAHHAFLATQILAHLDHLEATIAALSDRIAAALRPLANAIQRLDTIPGIKERTAEVLIAEIGVDMTRFPSDRHLASWVGICPGNHESAGKRKTGKTRKGNVWLRAALIEATLGATRTKNSAVAARYRRIMRHCGHKKAIVAVAHNLLGTAYHVLARQSTYQELGPDYYDRRHTERVTRGPSKALEEQGYRVTVERVA